MALSQEIQNGMVYEALTLDILQVDSSTPLVYEHGQFRVHNWAYNGYATVYLNHIGQKHRIYGPAYISECHALEEWYKEDVLHRVDGPARTHRKNWWWLLEGKLHRLDGPAVILGGGPKEYWINGIQFSPKAYSKKISCL